MGLGSRFASDAQTARWRPLGYFTVGASLAAAKPQYGSSEELPIVSVVVPFRGLTYFIVRIL